MRMFTYFQIPHCVKKKLFKEYILLCFTTQNVKGLGKADLPAS